MRIFISHSHQDKAEVDQIIKRLTDAGHMVRGGDMFLRPGDDILKKIQSEISAADAFIFVVSENSLKSKWVQKEFSYVTLSELPRRGIRIIPVILDSSPVPSYLASFIYLDMSKDRTHGIDLLIRSLEDIRDNREPSPAQINSQLHETLDAHISKLGLALKSGRLTLVCGAGVSVGAGVPVWNELLLNLLESMVERLSSNRSLNIDQGSAEEFSRTYGASSLILGKYLRNNLSEDFGVEIRDALYARDPKTCELIDSIVDLSRPKRIGSPLDSIITFNFDALIEENLTKNNIPNRAIYSEAVRHDPSELPVYHVHGFLPRQGDVPKDSDIVFSEDAYHSQFIDPFSWSNLIQLNKLSQNTCLLVGISLTDPNLRRLLDVAWRKVSGETPRHYIIKKAPKFSGKGAVVSDLAKYLEEQDANALGINVIWVDEFSDISRIINAICAVGV